MAATDDEHANDSDEHTEEEEEGRASAERGGDAHARQQPPGRQQSDETPRSTATGVAPRITTPASSMGGPSAPAPDAAASPAPVSAVRSDECSFLDARTDTDTGHVFSDNMYTAVI